MAAPIKKVLGRAKMYELLDLVGHDYTKDKGKIRGVTVHCPVDDVMTFELDMYARDTEADETK